MLTERTPLTSQTNTTTAKKVIAVEGNTKQISGSRKWSLLCLKRRNCKWNLKDNQHKQINE